MAKKTQKVPARKEKAKSYWVKRVALSVACTAIFFAVLEGVLRASDYTYKPREKLLWKPTVAGFVRTYEYYIQTEFDPPGYIWISQPNTSHTDAYGFRKPGVPPRKEPGKVRVAFMGGSTTQGANRPYPERAIRLINAAIGTNRYEMLNVGCSSYTTHQSLTALERWVLPRDPDVVIIYHGWNDPDVRPDGFSDHEKDFLLDKERREGDEQSRSKIAAWKTVQWVGKVVDTLDTSWPRPRVDPARFRKNLDAMINLCAGHGVPVLLFARPVSQVRPLPSVSDVYESCYEKRGHSTDAETRYLKIHETCLAIQHRAAEEQEGVSLFDACGFLNDLQARHRNGEFGEDLNIFMQDAIHIYEFAEQFLAEELAVTLAPEYAAQIEKRINSAEYHEMLSREYLNDDEPYASVWHARRAIDIAPEREAALKELVQAAMATYEFSRLFREGKWGGTDADFESKIRKLQQCQAKRPGDLGVCIQVFRVCMYMNHLDRAATAMAAFKPANRQDAYQWLNWTFQSHVAGKRWQQAVQFAEQILKLNPNDQQALGFLQAIRKSG